MFCEDTINTFKDIELNMVIRYNFTNIQDEIG